MFIPYKVDVDFSVEPIANFLIIGLTCLLFILFSLQWIDLDFYLLDGFNASLFSYGFMHFSWPHLLGNMFYLWIFGNAVCAVVGNATFPSVYFLLIILSAIAHLIFNDAAAIGASGAVNGIIGMYLFFYPRSNISCMWTVVWAWGKTFSIKAYWLISLWFLKDIIGALYSEAPIAYEAHLGGFISGIVIAYLMYKYQWIKPQPTENTMLSLFR